MQNVARTVRRSLPAALFLSAVISFSAVVGCNDKKNDNGGGGGGGATTTSSFAGWMANGMESGRLNVTINKAGFAHGRPGLLGPSAAVTASGSIELTGGGTTSLTGTFDDESYELHLAGGGYTFDGLYDSGPPGTVFGGYTGPNGGGRFAAESGGSSSAQIYGGSYTAEGSASTGTFLMAIRGTQIEGVATEDGDSTGLGFTGNLAGTAISIQSPIFNGYKMHGAGTLNPTTHHVSGRYNIDYGTTPADSGSWSGDLVTTATP